MKEKLDDFSTQLWIYSIFVFGFMDLFTTYIGVVNMGFEEENPLALGLLNSHGFEGLIALKIVVICFFILVWKICPDKFNIGVPVGLMLVGTGVSAWNLYLIAIAA